MDALDKCFDPGTFVTPRNKTVKLGALTREGVFTVDSNAIGWDVNVHKVRGGVFEQNISETYVWK